MNPVAFRVKVEVIGRVRRFASQLHFTLEIQSGATAQMLIDRLWLLLDHVPSGRDRSLKGGELVIFFRTIAGG